MVNARSLDVRQTNEGNVVSGLTEVIVTQMDQVRVRHHIAHHALHACLLFYKCCDALTCTPEHPFNDLLLNK